MKQYDAINKTASEIRAEMTVRVPTGPGEDDFCEVWIGLITNPSEDKPQHYGICKYGNRLRVGPHRLLLALDQGLSLEDLDGDYVLHDEERCNNGLCVREGHLRRGSQSENIKAAYAKGTKVPSVKKLTEVYFKCMQMRLSV